MHGLPTLLPHPPEVPAADHRDRQRDERLHERGGQRHHSQRGEDECHRVRHGEGGRRQHDVAQTAGADDEGEEEEDVVDAEQQVLGSEHEEPPESLEQCLLRAERRLLARQCRAARGVVHHVVDDRDGSPDEPLVVGEERAAQFMRGSRLARVVEREHGVRHVVPLGDSERAGALGHARDVVCRELETFGHVVDDRLGMRVERVSLFARAEDIHAVLEELRGVLGVGDGQHQEVVLQPDLGADDPRLRCCRVHVHGRGEAMAVRSGRSEENGCRGDGDARRRRGSRRADGGVSARSSGLLHRQGDARACR